MKQKLDGETIRKVALRCGAQLKWHPRVKVIEVIVPNSEGLKATKYHDHSRNSVEKLEICLNHAEDFIATAEFLLKAREAYLEGET